MIHRAYQLSSTPTAFSVECNKLRSTFLNLDYPIKLTNSAINRFLRNIDNISQTKKSGQILAPKEKKPPIVNNQCVVYKFKCDLCDADYVGYTARHVHQRINEHKYSAIGRHLEQHGLLKTDLVEKQFSVLTKCRSKFDCLIFDMLFIKELNPSKTLRKTLFAPNS